MQNPRKIAYVLWIDKKRVMLLSSCYQPIPSSNCKLPQVIRKVHGKPTTFNTNFMHVAYLRWMRRVDILDQMRDVYSCQVKSHKWWHWLLFFLLDLTSVNSYIIYKELATKKGENNIFMHLEFQIFLI